MTSNPGAPMSLAKALGVANRKLERGPVWSGPEGEDANGGITQSLLGRFLACRERFRVYAIEGLAPYDAFSAPMEFGTMFHLCLEVTREGTGKKGKGKTPWDSALLAHAKDLQRRYPLDAEKVAHWYQMCVAIYPEYLSWWKEEEESRRVIESEVSFDVSYRLPHSKRVVRLRGKRDGVSMMDGGLWLDENKTKSAIDRRKIQRQLKFDLQTMMYLVALDQDDTFYEANRLSETHAVRGVRYNVIRRSAHKSWESMLKKLHEDVADGRGEEWFGRWTVPVSSAEVKRFRDTCLDPLLEWICLWYDAMTGKGNTHLPVYTMNAILNYRHPYGVYNVLDEGGTSEYDEYLETGSMAGLRRVPSLFPELA